MKNQVESTIIQCDTNTSTVKRFALKMLQVQDQVKERKGKSFSLLGISYLKHIIRVG